MTLNLKSAEGRDIFLKLAEKADVVVENYRSDVKHRLGIDYEAVAKINPRIVYGSISGFGQTGPDAARPGVDQIAQGLGGLMSITGLPGQGPVRVGIPIADLTSGLLLAQAIMLALYQREQTGKGQWVHTSLLEAQIFMLDFQAARWLISGEVAGQAGNDHPTSVPTGVFPTSDGHINIAAAGEGLWKRICTAIGLPELATAPEFKTTELRSKNRKALNERIAGDHRGKPSAHWVKLLNAASRRAKQAPTGSSFSMRRRAVRRDQQHRPDFAEPQVQHLAIARPVTHPQLGDIKVVGQPINLSGAPQPTSMRPTPELGQHTGQILKELGVRRGRRVRLQSPRHSLSQEPSAPAEGSRMSWRRGNVATVDFGIFGEKTAEHDKRREENPKPFTPELRLVFPSGSPEARRWGKRRQYTLRDRQTLAVCRVVGVPVRARTTLDSVVQDKSLGSCARHDRCFQVLGVRARDWDTGLDRRVRCKRHQNGTGDNHSAQHGRGSF